MSMALNFLGGAPFQLLYDGVTAAIDRASKFKALLLNLETTLDCLAPRILQQIRDNNIELNLPNNIIQDLQVKMDEGIALLDELSRLSMWNWRIWGNCCDCCVKPNYADQLAALDRSLKRLLEILKAEQMRNVTELLILVRRTNDKQDDLEKRQLEIQRVLQETGEVLRSQQEVLERIERRNGVAATSDRGGGGGGGGGSASTSVLRAVFLLLFDAVIRVRVKDTMLKRLLEDFKSTLDCLKPLMEEMTDCNEVLNLPEEELEIFMMQMDKGVEIISKCSEFHKGTSYEKNECIKKLLGLNESLQRLFSGLKGQVTRNVKKTSEFVSNLEREIMEIEGSGIMQSGEAERESGIPLARSPLTGLDLENRQGTQEEVISETSDPVSDVEVYIREIGEVQYEETDTGSRIPVPQPESPAVREDLQHEQGTQEVIKVTHPMTPASNLEEKIEENVEEGVVQSDRKQGKGWYHGLLRKKKKVREQVLFKKKKKNVREPSLPTAGMSRKSMQGRKNAIEKGGGSAKLQDVKQTKGKEAFEYTDSHDYDLPSFPEGLELDPEDQADADSYASMEEEYSVAFLMDMYVSKLKKKLLDDNELAIVLTGPEGCGKTRLAEKFCEDEEVRNEFKNNIFFVPFSEYPTLELIVRRLYPEEGYREITLPEGQAANAIEWLDELAEDVRHLPSLLVLDDVWPGSESLLDEFAEFKTSNFKILVTSRFEFPRFGSSYHVEPMTDRELEGGR